MALIPFSRHLIYRSQSVYFQSAVRSFMSKQLVYSEFGDPVKVLRFRETRVRPLGDTEVLVRMLAAPINPADINTIQGKYPVKVELPVIAGNEGVGIIEEIGSGVKGLSPGNKVIVTKPVQGTWRDFGTFDKDVLRKVPDNLGVVEAATLTVNPCTAYRMLTDFVPVKEKGLVVIQNGANSACGQNVIQICKAWGVKNINIVRNRPEIAELKKYLEDLGATYVLTEEEVRSTTIFKDKKIEKPSLALNCVGGKSSSEMLRHLDHSGKMVTYGGMSREPVIIPTSAFIFKNISFYGYWMTAWYEKADQAQKDQMVEDIITLMIEKKLQGPVHKMVKFENYAEAVGNALSSIGYTGCRTPIKPKLPMVPGDEGVGDVVEIGRLVSRVTVGKRVILKNRLLGTWRYYGIYKEEDVHVVPPKLGLADAAMLAIAPCTAYRMLKDYMRLEYPIHTVVQSAANCPVGQSVIQLCHSMGIPTLNIVASHVGFETMKNHLLSIGATCVLTLEEAEDLTAFNTSVRRPILGINCLGGRHETVILKLLQANGHIVYYGGAYDLPMTKQAFRRDVIFHKFDLNKWMSEANSIAREVMFSDIARLMASGKHCPPIIKPVELRNYIYALRNTVHCDAFSNHSYIFDFTVP